MTQTAVEIFNESHQKSSLQSHFTFATTEKKYAKKDGYSTFENQYDKIINSVSIYINGRENQLFVLCNIRNLIIKIQCSN
uniref:Uncharacterized protein n=1 Tax=Strongyloides venezuelensis TaxID=75913 RepID=A0A0K0F7P2_STRVS